MLIATPKPSFLKARLPFVFTAPISRDEKRAARAKLFGDLAQATRLADVAAEAFVTATSDIPSGMPHPDGVQRIHNASHEMTAARNELIKAHDRLNKFLNTGIVPKDLKLSG